MNVNRPEENVSIVPVDFSVIINLTVGLDIAVEKFEKNGLAP
jgi:hypothetical protein